MTTDAPLAELSGHPRPRRRDAGADDAFVFGTRPARSPARRPRRSTPRDAQPDAARPAAARQGSEHARRGPSPRATEERRPSGLPRRRHATTGPRDGAGKAATTKRSRRASGLGPGLMTGRPGAEAADWRWTNRTAVRARRHRTAGSRGFVQRCHPGCTAAIVADPCGPKGCKASIFQRRRRRSPQSRPWAGHR